MSEDIKNLVKNLIVLLVVIVLSFYSSTIAGELYKKISGDPGTWVNLKSLFGFPLAYTFFLALLFTAFGDNKKYWWIGILLIPVVAFEVYFDLEHIYFPILLGLAGLLLGRLISKFIPNTAKQ